LALWRSVISAKACGPLARYRWRSFCLASGLRCSHITCFRALLPFYHASSALHLARHSAACLRLSKFCCFAAAFIAARLLRTHNALYFLARYLPASSAHMIPVRTPAGAGSGREDFRRLTLNGFDRGYRSSADGVRSRSGGGVRWFRRNHQAVAVRSIQNIQTYRIRAGAGAR